ncbi:MAG TPA: hypothetical protein VJ875_21185 [Pyrinomonadaceae bacterium]|nr:hypothetical protein [Pyrinomonadaceae bacterium]
MKRALLIYSAILFIAGQAAAQQAKPWTEWTDKEAAKVLNDSAWGQTQTEVAPMAEPTSTSAITQTTAARREDQRISSASTVESGESKTRPSINYRVRFLSAKPVRAAFVRMIELQGATPERVAELRTFVDRDFADYIVIALAVDGSDRKHLSLATEEINGADEALLQKTAYLERKDGTKLFLSNYRPPTQDGLGAKLVFPRSIQGKPFIDPSSGEIRFVLEMGKTVKISRKFKVAEMMYEGKLEY